MDSRKSDPVLSYVKFDKIRRNIISARVSSTSMDIAKIAMIEFRRRIAADPRWKNYEDRPKIVNCVHDEIVVECRGEDINDVENILNSCMKRLNGRSVDGAPSHFDAYVFGDRKLRVDIDAESEKSLINYAEAKPK
ncbi:MAG: DNA polymerase [Proteobacteria bacterium]|nr:DNA polymerase [Pseudomonadota bacterium]